MTLTPQDWHQRFLNQASWTAQMRRYLLYHLGLDRAARILETGCGTGVITAETHVYTQSAVFGLDLNPAYLKVAQQYDPQSEFTAGNVLHLPFSTGSFDCVFCHYFLLWIPQPAAALEEMLRVTRPGGWVIAFAEPDYGGRIDHPAPLDELGRLQTAALQQQGADPELGRKLAGLFNAPGLTNVEFGVLGGQWQGSPSAQSLESEWATLQADLVGSLPAGQLTHLQRLDEQAWQRGERVLFVPTFYAFGKKSEQPEDNFFKRVVKKQV